LLEMHRNILLRTNMIDSVIETYPADKTIPDDLVKRKDRILKELESLRSRCDPVVEVLENDDVKELMDSPRDREGNSKVLEHLQQKYGVSSLLTFHMYNHYFLVQTRGS
jgi:hypothetical protein